MGKTPFFPNKQNYLNHYCGHQHGGNLPVFKGQIIQEGYGFGGLIASLFRNILPMLGKTVGPILKSTAKAGARAAGGHLLNQVPKLAPKIIGHAISMMSNKGKKRKKTVISNPASSIPKKAKRGNNLKKGNNRQKKRFILKKINL